MPICQGFRASGLSCWVARLFISHTSTEYTIVIFEGPRALDEFIIHDHTTRKFPQYIGVLFTMIYAQQVPWDVLADAEFMCDKDAMFRGMIIPDRLCTYNVILRCIHSTTVTEEKQYYTF